MQRLDYLRRLVGTGLSFALFGLGGLLIGLIAFPLISLVQRHRDRRQRAAQWLIHKTFAFFMDMMHFLGVLNYEIRGLKKLQGSRGELIVANHPTLVDVVFLISRLPRADCIVKTALWNNPFTRGPVQSAGYILNDGSPALVDRCVARLQRGASLIIFPEGTRTAKGARLNEFQRGAANVAARSGAPFRPVIIRCTPSTLTKNEKWYQIPSRRFLLTMDVLDVLPVNDIIANAGNPSLAARHINTMLHDFFNEELKRHEHAGTGAEGADHLESGAGRHPAG